MNSDTVYSETIQSFILDHAEYIYIAYNNHRNDWIHRKHDKLDV